MNFDPVTRRAPMPIFIGGRYRLIERLGAGGMGTVYRAYDRLTGVEVALKRVLAPTDQLQFASRMSHAATHDPRVALAQEFRALASLRHPNIISVKDYGFDSERQPFYTMELLENSQTILEAGRGKPPELWALYLIQTLQALIYLHRRGILHRDLKPSNVLVSRSTVHVLDFGLSVQASEAKNATGTAGTVAYMPPEALAEEAPPTVAGDLYAVGVMLYEMIIGKHPFDAANVYAMIFATLNNEPDLSGIANTAIADLLRKLLAKTPEERPANAQIVVEALCGALDLPLPLETQAIRESFLQAAQLVGRNTELGQLSQVLDLALHGQGSAWAIAGESGVGKSRLLEEIRILALVKGALTLRGQAISEGGLPYQPWRDPLQRLAIATPDLTDHEASILKPFVPDLEQLIERPIPDAPEVDPQSARLRLLTTIEGILKRQTQPVVFIMEDFHWASNESLELLAWLSRAAALSTDFPLLILTSYRVDEQPPAIVPEMQIIRLRRLLVNHIADLAEAMLGEAGREPSLITYLDLETEGNAFFLVEVMRALAEDSGELSRIVEQAREAGLPEHIVTGGVDRLVRRRVERVPLRARPLLQIAALLGRQPDLDILAATDPQSEVEDWLDTCAELNLFEFFDGVWRFSHEKLRETLLADMTAGEKRALHRRIAVAYEQVYPNHGEQAGSLAYHWGQAGEIGKEMQFTAQAGTLALRGGAFSEALKFLSRARELVAKLNTVPPQGDGKVGPLALRQAILERQLADVFYGLGNISQSREHLQNALSLLKVPIPPKGIYTRIGREIFKQIWHRAAPKRTFGRAPIGSEYSAPLLEAIRAHERLALITWIQGDLPTGLLTVIRGVNLAEHLGTPAEMARNYADFAVGLGTLRLSNLAEQYIVQALNISKGLGDLATRLWVCVSVATYYVGLGQWEESREKYVESLEIADRIKDRIRLQDSARFLAWQTRYQGEFGRAAQMQRDLYAMAERGQDPLYQAYALIGRGDVELPLGKYDSAAEALAKAAHLTETQRMNIPNSVIWNYGLLASAYWRLHDQNQAIEAAYATINAIKNTRLASFFAGGGFVGAAEVLLSLWESGNQSHTQAAQQTCKSLYSFAWRYPAFQPAALRLNGLAAWLGGNQRRASVLWQRSLEAARSLGMPHEAGLIQYEIGRHAPHGEARTTALREARDIFGQLGAMGDLVRVRGLLTRSQVD